MFPLGPCPDDPETLCYTTSAWIAFACLYFGPLFFFAVVCFACGFCMYSYRTCLTRRPYHAPENIAIENVV